MRKPIEDVDWIDCMKHILFKLLRDIRLMVPEETSGKQLNGLGLIRLVREGEH